MIRFWFMMFRGLQEAHLDADRNRRRVIVVNGLNGTAKALVGAGGDFEQSRAGAGQILVSCDVFARCEEDVAHVTRSGEHIRDGSAVGVDGVNRAALQSIFQRDGLFSPTTVLVVLDDVASSIEFKQHAGLDVGLGGVALFMPARAEQVNPLWFDGAHKILFRFLFLL